MALHDDGCPYCGRVFYDDRHLRVCRTTAVQKSDGCPMCGEKYSCWLDHLKACEGGG